MTAALSVMASTFGCLQYERAMVVISERDRHSHFGLASLHQPRARFCFCGPGTPPDKKFPEGGPNE